MKILFIKLFTIPTKYIGLEWSLFNTVGQELMQGQLQAENTQLNVDPLPSGVYFLKIGTSSTKITKQ